MGFRGAEFCLFCICCIYFGLVIAVPYQEKHYDQALDHFNFESYGDQTFKQRYLIQDKWWNYGKGPIFFYTGNEGDITDFWAATGFVFDIAPQFGALVVFAEHRYYGTSLPFGEDSFSEKNIGLLTMEQAMADYAILINHLKETLNATKCRVISFGGSYGGMLSAYMRFKYPNLISGSIAASAPLNLLTPTIDRHFFFNAVTKAFSDATPQCGQKVRQAFIEMKDIFSQGAAGLQKLSSIFRLCKPITDAGGYYHLQGWVRNSFSNLAMFNYPYPAKLFVLLPADPVQVACNYMEQATDVIDGLAQAAGLFYNGSEGSLKCFDIFSEFVACADPTGCGTGDASKAWDYQACTEIHLSAGSNNVTDMFPELPFTDDMRRDYCMKAWNVVPRDVWGNVQFWGKDLQTASNIVFSNGDLDPWKNGGVLKAPTGAVKAVTIAGGAHHLDLRAKNPKDPIGVKAAREVECAAIRKWVNS